MTGDSLLPANPYLLRELYLMFSGPMFYILCFVSYTVFSVVIGSLSPRYFATIGTDGQCKCPPPQQCDGY